MKKQGIYGSVFSIFLFAVNSLNAQVVSIVPVAYSEDETIVVFEDLDSTEGVGGNPGARFRIVDIRSGEELDVLKTAYNYQKEDPWDTKSYEDFEHKNKELREGIVTELESQGFIFSNSLISEASLPLGVRVDYFDRDNIDPEKPWLYELSFYLTHDISGMYTKSISIKIYQQRDSKTKNEGVYEGDDFLGISWTIIGDEVRFFAGTNLYFVPIKTPSVMDFIEFEDMTKHWREFIHGFHSRMMKAGFIDKKTIKAAEEEAAAWIRNPYAMNYFVFVFASGRVLQ